ncbi:PRC-barrel domain-containing protein [Azospirillum thermophilum]|nr:PRC-barrel domain-containing protein [Azospirillum thermophilum]
MERQLMRILLPAALAAMILGAAGPAFPIAGEMSVEGLKGRTVVGRDGQPIGQVTDVLLDSDGAARQVVVSAIDLLRVGGKEVAFDIADVRLRSDSNHLHLPGMTRADVADLPDYTPESAGRR